MAEPLLCSPPRRQLYRVSERLTKKVGEILVSHGHLVTSTLAVLSLSASRSLCDCCSPCLFFLPFASFSVTRFIATMSAVGTALRAATLSVGVRAIAGRAVSGFPAFAARPYSTAGQAVPSPPAPAPIMAPPTFSLAGKLVLLTGAARGLGLVMGQAIVASGADLAMVDLNSRLSTVLCYFPHTLLTE